jgi:hypothetical protein
MAGMMRSTARPPTVRLPGQQHIAAQGSAAQRGGVSGLPQAASCQGLLPVLSGRGAAARALAPPAAPPARPCTFLDACSCCTPCACSTHLWVDAHILATPAIGDIDGDGSEELVVAVSYFYDREYYEKPVGSARTHTARIPLALSRTPTRTTRTSPRTRRSVAASWAPTSTWGATSPPASSPLTCTAAASSGRRTWT